MNGPKVLLLDIETAPIKALVWGIWEQNIPWKQVKKNWHLLSWSAKWLGTDKVMYMDQRSVKNIEDDTLLLRGMRKLLDEADVIITHNGKKFDNKRLNARFVIKGVKPPSSYKHVDTLMLARKHFDFTSNKLADLAKILGVKHQKYEHKKYAGFDLWDACLEGDKKAWAEMSHYNKLDVLTLEDVYKKLIPYEPSINYDLYRDDTSNICHCGSNKFSKNGFFYTQTAKYQRFKCSSCDSETRSRINLFTKEKRESLRLRTTR